jgi:hypothetical protein
MTQHHDATPCGYHLTVPPLCYWTALSRAQCTTIRLTLLTIGARIRITIRKVWLVLASGCLHAALSAQVQAHLRRC